MSLSEQTQLTAVVHRSSQCSVDLDFICLALVLKNQHAKSAYPKTEVWRRAADSIQVLQLRTMIQPLGA